MAYTKALQLWNGKRHSIGIAAVVQLLLISATSFAQSPPTNLPTDLATADSIATQPPVSVTSISTVIVTVLSTLTSQAPQESPPLANTTSPPTSSSATASSASSSSSTNATSPQNLPPNVNTSTQAFTTDPSLNNSIISTRRSDTALPTSSGPIAESNGTWSTTTSSVGIDITSPTNSSDGMETMEPTSLSSVSVTNNDTMSLTTSLSNDVVTYEQTTDGVHPTNDVTTLAIDEGILTESFLRLIIIAGATAGSCLVLLIVVFIIVVCCHRRRQRKKNARYYEFKKKDYSSKYEKVEQRNSLARQRDHAENIPIGGGWVFNTSGYHGDYEDETTPSVALRSISPIAVATPLLKVSPVEDSNGVPDSGHGGSITAEDSALGHSPSLEEDIEMELNPLYKALGATSVGTGSETRDHSYIGGESDTISEGNEPVDDAPIRDVHFNSFGANRAVSEEAVEL